MHWPFSKHTKRGSVKLDDFDAGGTSPSFHITLLWATALVKNKTPPTKLESTQSFSLNAFR